MRFSERRKKFRAILNGNACLHPGSVADPMTARITQEVGFELGIFAGFVASMNVLAAPDRDELLEWQRLVQVVDDGEPESGVPAVDLSDDLLDLAPLVLVLLDTLARVDFVPDASAPTPPVARELCVLVSIDGRAGFGDVMAVGRGASLGPRGEAA